MLDAILIIAIIILIIRSYKQESKINLIENKLHKLQIDKINTQAAADSVITVEPEVKPKQPPINAKEKVTPYQNINNRATTRAEEPKILLKKIQNKLIASAFGKKLVNFFTMGNLPTKIGILILVAGVGFLLKDISPKFVVPITARLIISAVGGILALILGIKWHNKTHNYGLILQGGGFAILYAVIIFAYNQYHLIGYLPAFIILLAIAISSIILALKQDSKELIIFAELGGFMLPLMVANTHGNIYNLFTYYAVLNIIIAVIAWFKNWRELNLIGFVATFIIATTCGVLKYTPQHYLGMQLFLVFFVMLYIIISILFVSKESPTKISKLNSSLIFGVPLIGFAIQCSLVQNFSYGAAKSAFALTTIYVSITIGLWLLNKNKFKFLIFAFINLIVTFISLGVLLLWQYRLTESFLAIEGVLLVWFGIQTRRKFHTSIGVLLLALSIIGVLISFINGWTNNLSSKDFIIDMIVAITIYITAFLFGTYTDSHTQSLKRRDIFWLIIANSITLITVINYFWTSAIIAQLVIIGIAYIIWAIAMQLKWQSGIKATLWLVVLNSAWLGLRWFEANQFTTLTPFAQLALIYSNYYLLVKTNQLAKLAKSVRISDMFLRVTIIMQTIICWLNSAINLHINNEWQFIGTGVLICLFTFAYARRPKFINYPIAQSEGVLRNEFCFTMIVMLYLITVLYNLAFVDYAGNQFYIPLLNPFDLVMAGALALMIYIFMKDYRNLNKPLIKQDVIKVLIGIWVFIWLTWMALRAVHSYTGIAYNTNIFDSMITQTILSILWAVIGFTLTVAASKTAKRTYWLTGGSLLIIVVIKMLAFDMSGVNNFTRIISFIGVGLILLMVGYFAPVPPKKTDI